jgi:hypothetical protein
MLVPESPFERTAVYPSREIVPDLDQVAATAASMPVLG